MAQLETATIGAGLDMDSASADSASASPTRRSRWKTWKTWRERPQPCLMRDKRVARQMGCGKGAKGWF